MSSFSRSSSSSSNSNMRESFDNDNNNVDVNMEESVVEESESASTFALLNPLLERTALLSGWRSRISGTNEGHGNESVVDHTGSGVSVSNSRVGTPSINHDEDVLNGDSDPQNREKALRKKILLIHKDETLSASAKARKIQELMSGRWSSTKGSSDRASSTGSLAASSSQNSGSNLSHSSVIEAGKIREPCEEECKQTYHVEETGVLGCSHYARKCKLYASCCDKYFHCRFCHDEASDHTLNRFSTSLMLCMLCKKTQPAGQDCCFCKETMASYYCEKCKFWDDDDAKKIYHCDDCGICRIGRGLDQDFFHCPTCACCLAISLKGNHRCIERSVDCDCPVCGDYMFTSTTMVRFMPCGHPIHNTCFDELKLSSYQCPICWKSLGNMDEYFTMLDSALEQHSMPDEYKNIVSEILCNDCETKSHAPFHFLYHKCGNCGGYNTRLIKTLDRTTASILSTAATE